jgi:hypothetical protein
MTREDREATELLRSGRFRDPRNPGPKPSRRDSLSAERRERVDGAEAFSLTLTEPRRGVRRSPRGRADARCSRSSSLSAGSATTCVPAPRGARGASSGGLCVKDLPEPVGLRLPMGVPGEPVSPTERSSVIETGLWGATALAIGSPSWFTPTSPSGAVVTNRGGHRPTHVALMERKSSPQTRRAGARHGAPRPWARARRPSRAVGSFGRA